MFLELTTLEDRKVAIRACTVYGVKEAKLHRWNDETEQDEIIFTTEIEYATERSSDVVHVKEDYQDVMSKLR